MGRKQEPGTDLAAVDELETAERAWYASHTGVPGMVVHATDEIAWMRGPGVTWSNAAIRIRYPAARIDQKLRSLFGRAFADGRGFGMWVSDLATPADLGRRLSTFGFRSRKRFPAMRAKLDRVEALRAPKGVELSLLTDTDLFARFPHPYFGPATTAIRRFEIDRARQVRARHCDSVFEIIARRGDVPVGAATVLVDGRVATVHDVGVLESERGQGIGGALTSAVCAEARARGARSAVLLASGMGHGVYLRAGFQEVGRIAYWYAANAPKAK